MSRGARKKEPLAIYHVTSRSITEFDLFPQDSDKEKFLDLLHHGAEKNHCKVYGYCLMTNHYHIILDTCGYDISDFMRVLNQRYARHINDTYNRKGHLFGDRFNSKIIDNENYLLTVSAYVHNNSKDIPGYNGREADYPYSSFGIYLGKRKDKRDLIDTTFVLGCIDENNRSKAIKAYAEMVIEKRDLGTNSKLKQYLDEFKSEQNEYKSYRQVLLRDKKPEEILKLLSEKFEISDSNQMMSRWKRKTMNFRSVLAYTLNVFCGMNITKVCNYMKNITASCCAQLRDKGYEIIRLDHELEKAILCI